MISGSDNIVRAAALIALSVLAGCKEKNVVADRHICLDPPALSQHTTDACVHRWAYRLAGAPESARDVASAVTGGCAANIGADIYNMAKGDPARTDYWTPHIRRMALEKALFHVVQARAGHCDIP